MCVREMLLTGILKVQLHEAENISDWRIIKCRLFCLNADHMWTIFPQKSALRTQCGLCGLFRNTGCSLMGDDGLSQ